MNDITQKLRLIFGVEGEEKANTQVKSLDKSIMGLAKNIGLAAIAYKTFTTALDIGKKSLQNYNEQIIAMRQIETTLRSTGQAVNWTTQELANMASELQNVSKFGDEEILKGATQSLLRFDGISKELFPRVQALTVDMAEGMGSLEGAAKTLGISLADPLLGMTRLRRAGVMFNETQQATIKGFVESGKKIEAQRVLLDALEGKYKGLALASATTTQQLKNAWSDYLETVGGSLSFFEGVKSAFMPGLAPGALDIPAVPIASTGRNNLSNININNQQNELMMSLVGLATGGIGGAGIIPSIAPGAFDLPPAPIASTGRNNLSTININNQQNELMMSIDGLKREIASSREQNFNLYLDGLPLRNAIKRVEKNLNIMGS